MSSSLGEAAMIWAILLAVTPLFLFGAWNFVDEFRNSFKKAQYEEFKSKFRVHWPD